MARQACRHMAYMLLECDALNLATRNGHQDVTRLFYDHEVAVNDMITLEPPCLIAKDESMENSDKRVKVCFRLLVPVSITDRPAVGAHWAYAGAGLPRNSDPSIFPRR